VRDFVVITEKRHWSDTPVEGATPMSGKLIQAYQIHVYMKARDTGLSQGSASTLADFSTRSGQRIEQGTHQPQRGRVRDWRSRPDPLAAVWESELEPMLQRHPQLKPTTLFEYLQERYPGEYAPVLRTLQRRVETWKALHGSTPEVMFELRHIPGMVGFSDFTELTGVGITIAGQPFTHILYHYRLGYSGWQYAQIIQGGESFVALAEGLQNALFACGGAPRQHRTDSLSAAYRNLGGGGRKPLTQLYDGLCQHYRLEPTRNNRGIAHENGAIESPHGHLKNRIKQALMMRDSCDFASIAEYQALIDTAVAQLNAPHQDKYLEEQLALQPLPKYRVPDYEVLSARVSSRSTVDVRCILYTVPSRLIGRQLELHLYHDRIIGYLGQQVVVTLARRRVTAKDKRRARCIDYRHVIEALRRKPRAFLYATWQQDLLPNPTWQDLWQQIRTQFDLDSAAMVIVEALYIAATQDKEPDVAAYLQQQLSQQSLTLANLRRQFQLLRHPDLPQQHIPQHDLADYDQFLPSHHGQPTDPPTQSAAQSPTATQTTPVTPDPESVGTHRTTGDAGAMVLCPVLARTVRIGGGPPLAWPYPTGFDRGPITQRQNPDQFRLGTTAKTQSRAHPAIGRR
jgi:hypothetical protein